MNSSPQTQTPDRMSSEASNIKDFDGKDYAVEIKVTAGTSATVRFLDGSNEFEKCSVSWFNCDDDKIRPFTIENSHEGPGVLARLIGDPNNFYKGGYLESKKGQVGKINVHQAKDPELFKRLTEYYNPGFSGLGSIKPRKDYVYNAIHRNPELIGNVPMNWCALNKHTKLVRLGPKLFKCVKTVRDNDGEFVAYDIVLSKEGKGKDTVPSAMKAGINVEHKVIGDLLPEEKTYERYDLKHETRLASATYILKYLRNTIERIDRVMGTNYLQELEQQKAIEAAAFQSQQQAEEALIPQSQDMSNMGPAAMGLPPRQAGFPNTAPSPMPTPGVPPMSSRVPLSTSNTGQLEPCGHCKEMIPAGAMICPNCKGHLQSACEICHQPFSVFANQCPHCKTVYKTK